MLNKVTFESYYNTDFNSQNFIVRIPINALIELEFTYEEQALLDQANATPVYAPTAIKALIMIANKIEQNNLLSLQKGDDNA